MRGLLDPYPAAIAGTAHELVALIRQSFPELESRLAPGWQGVTFHHASAGYVACAMVAPERVSLMFVNGRELSDPEGVLVDHGNRSGFLRFQPGGKIEPGRIIPLMLEAIAIRA